MVEIRPTDWPEKFFSGQSTRRSSRVILSPSYTKWFYSSIDLVVRSLQREDSREGFRRFDQEKAISTLLFLVARKACREHKLKLTYYFSLIVAQFLKLSSSNLYSETLQANLPVARAKQLDRSMNKTTWCKKATGLPGQTSSLIGQKKIFLAIQRDGSRLLLELIW